MYRKVSIVSLIFTQLLFASIDTLECLNYLPLQTGNKWKYEVARLYTPGWDTTRSEKTIIGDTLMENGRIYRNMYPSGPYLRIDTTALLVYQYGDMSWAGCTDSESVLFDLTLLISGIDSFIRCNDIVVFHNEHVGNAGYIQGTFNNFSDVWYSGIGIGYTVTEGIGISCFSMEEIFVHSEKLLGAEINGQKYGSYAEIDTQKCLSFFPLQVGNKWEYMGISIPLGGTIDTSYFTESITEEVYCDNGKKYYKLVGQKTSYLRIDTLSLLVYKYDETSCNDSETVWTDLSLICSEEDSFINCSGSILFAEPGIGNAGKIHGNFSNMEYSWKHPYTVSEGYTLSQGLGLSYWGFFEIGGFDKYLIGALIDGQRYGSYANRDTLDYLSYYPMHIGDKWQYRNSIYYSASEYQIWYSFKEIIGDTVLQNGKRYFSISNNGSKNDLEFIRIDTTNLCVNEYKLYACNNGEIEMLYLYCNPDSSETEIYNCNSEYFLINKLDSCRIKNYHDYIIVQQYTLKKGIGVECYSECEAVADINTSLIAAYVNGVQYGEFLNVDANEIIPEKFELLPNFPNPFNPSTQIRFSIAKTGFVELTIYNIKGQLVRTIVSQSFQAGQYSKTWDGKNESGHDMASGIYFCILRFDGQIINQQKMLKMK